MLKIRLRRMGSTHRPFYRVVVSDSRRTPTASAIEELGFYDPRKEPSVVSLELERIEHWTQRGAQLSSAVRKLVKQGPSAARTETVAAAAEAETVAAAEAETAAAAEAETAASAEAETAASAEAETAASAEAKAPEAEEGTVAAEASPEPPAEAETEAASA